MDHLARCSLFLTIASVDFVKYRGFARIFKGGVTLCQSEGTHKIVVSFLPHCRLLVKKKLTKRGSQVPQDPPPPNPLQLCLRYNKQQNRSQTLPWLKWSDFFSSPQIRHKHSSETSSCVGTCVQFTQPCMSRVTNLSILKRASVRQKDSSEPLNILCCVDYSATRAKFFKSSEPTTCNIGTQKNFFSSLLC